MQNKEFSTNTQRLDHLDALIRAGDDAWRDQAWEWLTTGSLSREDFEKLLDVVADEAAWAAASRLG